VKEELKQFNRMKRTIKQALQEGPLSIPELAEKLDADKAEVTYYLMSLRKYGIVTTGELDDMDEYYYYQLKK
jgi:predicted transcriptional regulator